MARRPPVRHPQRVSLRDGGSQRFPELSRPLALSAECPQEAALGVEDLDLLRRSVQDVDVVPGIGRHSDDVAQVSIGRPPDPQILLQGPFGSGRSP